jgi:hypothetical protein
MTRTNNTFCAIEGIDHAVATGARIGRRLVATALSTYCRGEKKQHQQQGRYQQKKKAISDEAATAIPCSARRLLFRESLPV